MTTTGASGPEELTFEVEGMTCASCAVRVERILSKQEGVEAAAVSFAGGEARVRTDPGIDPGRLRQAVQKIGYDLVLVRTEQDRHSIVERYSEEERRQWHNFWGAAILALPVTLLAMLGPMDASWSRIAQAALATPVVWWFGRQFHLAALKRARAGSASMDTLISLGTVVAWAYSVWALTSDEELFFEVAAIIVALILLGRAFEAVPRVGPRLRSASCCNWAPRRPGFSGTGARRWCRSSGWQPVT